MKQETLEELAEKYYPAYPDGVVTSEIYSLREGFIKGAKCQQEQSNKEIAMWKLAVEKQEARCKALKSMITDLQQKSYSEEEVLDILHKHDLDDPFDHKKWFEQFKKEKP